MSSRLSGRCYTGLGNTLCSSSRCLEGLTEAIPGAFGQMPACTRMRAIRPVFRPSSRANSQGVLLTKRNVTGEWRDGGRGRVRNRTLVLPALKVASFPAFLDLVHRCHVAPGSRLEFHFCAAANSAGSDAENPPAAAPSPPQGAALLHAQKVESPAALPVDLRRNSAEFTVDYLP